MNFKEFDMSEYYNVLEEFKEEHEDKVIKMYGSMDKYNEWYYMANLYSIYPGWIEAKERFICY